MYKVKDFYELLKHKGFISDYADVFRMKNNRIYSSTLVCVYKEVNKDMENAYPKYTTYTYVSTDIKQEALIICTSNILEYYSEIIGDVICQPAGRTEARYEFIDEWGDEDIEKIHDLQYIDEQTIRNIENMDDVHKEAE